MYEFENFPEISWGTEARNPHSSLITRLRQSPRVGTRAPLAAGNKKYTDNLSICAGVGADGTHGRQ